MSGMTTRARKMSARAVASAELSSEVEEPRRAQSDVGPSDRFNSEPSSWLLDTLERDCELGLLIESPRLSALVWGLVISGESHEAMQASALRLMRSCVQIYKAGDMGV